MHSVGQSDLTHRFISTCNTAVDWALYGVKPYTTEHAQCLLEMNEEDSLPTNISLTSQASIVEMDVAFVRFLLLYFHRALVPVLRKVGMLILAVSAIHYNILT